MVTRVISCRYYIGMVVNRKKRYRLSKKNVNNLMDRSVEIALFGPTLSRHQADCNHSVMQTYQDYDETAADDHARKQRPVPVSNCVVMTTRLPD